MTKTTTTGIHGQRIMTALSAEPFRFRFQASTGDAGRAHLVGTSEAEYSRTTTAVLIGERDDLFMLEVSVLTGPPEYVPHTTVGFAIMTAAAKMASDDAFAWLKPLLDAGAARLTPGMMHATNAGRLRLVLRSQFAGNGPHIQISFIVSPNKHFHEPQHQGEE